MDIDFKWQLKEISVSLSSFVKTQQLPLHAVQVEV